MPRWLLLLLTGTIASTVISFLHSGEEAKEKEKEGAKQSGGSVDKEVPEWAKEAEAAGGSTSASAPTTPSKGSAKKRKGGKK